MRTVSLNLIFLSPSRFCLHACRQLIMYRGENDQSYQTSNYLYCKKFNQYPRPFYPQPQLFTNKLTHYPRVIGRRLRYQYANLSNSWNTRGLQLVKPLRFSCLIRFIFRVKGQPNTIIMLCNFQVTLHSRMTFTNLVECSLVRVLLLPLHYSLLHSRVGSQEPLI